MVDCRVFARLLDTSGALAILLLEGPSLQVVEVLGHVGLSHGHVLDCPCGRVEPQRSEHVRFSYWLVVQDALLDFLLGRQSAHRVRVDVPLREFGQVLACHLVHGVDGVAQVLEPVQELTTHK